ncbi:MAG: FHA domain-containing protein [Lachnospiraceae bacterium]
MRILTIIDTQGTLKEFNLDTFAKPQILMGRNAQLCDIVLADNIVSKCHGIIKLTEGKIYYSDNESSNGTFIENYASRRLLDKNSGQVELVDNTILKIGALDQPDKMILLLYHEVKEGVRWQRLNLSDRVETIGRSTDNQIVLNHPGISQIHARVEKGEYGFQLYDNHSTNGVMINGQTLTAPRRLKDKDVIQILNIQLIFSGTCIYYYQKASAGIYLKVNNVSKQVGTGGKCKLILQDVNCEIKGNEFVAIIGGSGAGKSTLMNVISGFDTKFTGKVYCNGVDLISQFQNLKNIIGYVPQEDIIYENLTLKKMLYYTAKLKMPEDMTNTEIKARIDEVLNMVDLAAHQDTYIRKLSGGQKKRASIAVELLADPSLFFLDEPTSGLDPGTEKNLMQTLNSLAKGQNKTVIMVTHTTQNLHLCDKIIFMGPGGRLCFCGNVDQAKQFFGTDDLVNVYNMIAANPEKWQQVQAHKARREDNDIPAQSSNIEAKRTHRTAPLRQLIILIRRYVELVKNDQIRLLILLLQPLIIGALLYVVADDQVFEIYESTKSMLFALSCSAIWIGIFDAIQEVCKERPILKREYMANLKLPCYILSKFLVQTVLGLCQALILTTVFMKLVGVDQKGIVLDHFYWEILLVVWLTILASIAMGLIISAVVKSGDKAMAAAPFVLIIQLLFSGILFTLEGAGKVISYFTISRWSVEGLGSIAKLNRLDLRLQEDFPMLEHEAESFFKASLPHLINTQGILIVMVVVLILISMITLRSLSKDSR